MGTSFLPYLASGIAPDPYFGNVALLMHFDGEGGVWKDSSSYNHTMTAPGTAATFDTTTKKFGNASFAGARTPSPFGLYCSNSNFKFDSLWTVEVWVYLDTSLYTANVSEQICGVHGGGALYSTIWGLSLLWDGSANWYTRVEYSDASGTGVSSLESSAIPASTYSGWHNIAVTRNGTATNGLKLFLDGNVIGQRTVSHSLRFSSGLNFTVGAYATNSGAPTLNPFGGRMDELRVTKNVCRYTSAYTPASQAFPNS